MVISKKEVRNVTFRACFRVSILYIFKLITLFNYLSTKFKYFHLYNDVGSIKVPKMCTFISPK